MKAMIYTEYGPPEVLQLKEIEKPTPKDDEVLVKVHTASVNAAEWHLMRADPFLVRFMTGLLKPKTPTIPGADIAGHVESVGSAVTHFKPGDAVFGFGLGAYAEYVCARASKLTLKPVWMAFEQAAAIPIAGITALQGLLQIAKIKAGQSVLINGAVSGVGTYAVQMAKSFGADVTAVCSTRKLDVAHTLGADRVIDYTREEVTRGDRRYDIIFDIAAHRSFLDYRPVMNRSAAYVQVGGSNKSMFQVLSQGKLHSKTGGQTFTNFLARERSEDLAAITQLFETGAVRSVIDRCYPLSAAAEALRHVEQGRARGKVLISIAEPVHQQ